MAITAADRALRLVSIAAWFPAMAFLIAHAVITGALCPALGLVPTSAGLVFAVAHVYNRAPYRTLNLLIDLFCAIFLLGTLIPGWVMIRNNWYGGYRWFDSVEGTMLGCYGTVPLMVNFCIHTFFVARTLFSRLQRPDTCPNCQHQFLARWGQLSGSSSGKSSISKESYAPVSMIDTEEGGDRSTSKQPVPDSDSKDPRPSTDDETARLV